MGAYLSSPICDKDTHEGANTRLAFAASSMQGWRMSQEDAHNAILNFDENTSFFAVYDGHGGSEIAIYCSQYLPEFLKKLKTYQDGRLDDALIESFIQFDSRLLDLNVKKILQRLANDEQEESDHEHQTNSNEENAEEAQLLKKEAEVPIEELLKRYNGEEKHFHSPNITKRILPNNEEKIDPPTEPIAEEIQPSESKTTERRVRKAVTESDSLTRQLISDETDEDEDDDSFNLSEEETSGDEAEEHGSGEEQDDGGEEKPLDQNKTTQFQKLMRKSIMAILNRRVKKKKGNDDEDDAKENQNDESGNEEEEEEENDDEEQDDDDEEEDEQDEEEDLGMLDMENDPGSSSGCTAVVTLVRDKQLFVANAGDSRCVVSRAGQAVEMSVDHKPEDVEERKRIEKAGYKVTLDGRVSGGLNLSRAIGDHAYKKSSSLPAEEQAITALPDIRTLSLDDQDEFMVIACDGIWNFMSSQDVIDFVRLRLEKKSLSQICEELFMHCLAPNTSGDGTGCDNMTAIIVKFNFSSPSSTNKRPLSPDPISTNDSIENSNNKKLKILSENGTNENQSTE